MTIKELMAQVDVNRVVDAFLLLDYNFSAENFENTLFEKHKSIPRLREVIKENIRLFAECVLNDDAELYTIFIILTPSDDYEDQCRKELSAFAICDEEALEVIDKNFHIFDDEGEARISHYGFDDAPIRDMANYTIAQSSLDEIGEEICAAKVLSELFFWGALPEDRKKRVDELSERIGKSIDEKNMLASKDLEEIFGEHRERFLAGASDDEKAYYLAKERFEDETEDIVRRYSRKVWNEIHKQYIAAIKAEYRRREVLNGQKL